MADNKTEFTPPPEITGSAAWFRLDGQQRYYSARSSLYQDRYKHIKLALIFVSATIPIIAFLPWADTARYLVAGSGVLIAVLEGILLLNRYGEHGITYRRTSEGLKRERALLLAERTEALLDEENKQWQQQQAKAIEELTKTAEWTSKQVAAAAEAAKKPGG